MSIHPFINARRHARIHIGLYLVPHSLFLIPRSLGAVRLSMLDDMLRSLRSSGIACTVLSFNQKHVIRRALAAGNLDRYFDNNVDHSNSNSGAVGGVAGTVLGTAV